MISCSNCGKSIADDAVHCGHCGHKIERTTNQKTMMGFALSPEDLQKAIAEASQQRAAQAPAQEPQDDSFGGPVDGLAHTEILPSISGNPALSDTLDPDSDLATEAEQVAAEPSFGSAPGMGNLGGTSPDMMGGPGSINEPSVGFTPSPSVQDPFSQPAPGPINQPMAPMSQSPLQNTAGDQEGEESFVQKNKKVLIIVGALVALSFGCCILSTLLRFVF